MKSFVAYRRLSKDGGDTSLGLAAQQSAIESYIRSHGGTLLADYVDNGLSGADTSRPELARAIEHATRCKATLVVQKIDRLSRDTIHALTLMRDHDIVACDTGDDPLLNGMMSLFAQRERDAISLRIRAALQVRRERGLPMGNTAALEAHRTKGHATQRAAADARAEHMRRQIRLAYAEAGTFLGAAALLNRDGVKTARGCLWSDSTVARMVRRLQTVAP